MNTNKNRILKLATLSALMLLPLLHTLSAWGGPGPLVEMTFTKWLNSFPYYTGIVEGDITGTLSTELVEFVPPDPLPASNAIRQVEATFHIYAGERSFDVELQGHQNGDKGEALLNGVITDGWHEGARVQVEYDVLPGPFGVCPRKVCFVGTIRVMPN